MLPSINLGADFNSQDTKKQISALKSQMASLKDAIEDELNNISYDQLDALLKKKIDSINDTAMKLGENIEMVAATIKADYVTTDVLKANYITADQISANYASYGWVSALNAIVGTIQADYVTTGQLNAVTISASQITSGRIKTARLDVDDIAANAFSAYDSNFVVKNLRVSQLLTYGSRSYGPIEVLTPSGTAHALGY